MGRHPKYEVLWQTPPDEGGRLSPGESTRRVGGRTVRIELGPRAMLSLSEVAAIVERNPATVWRWVQSGKLKARRSGRTGQLTVPLSALRDYLPRAKPGQIFLAGGKRVSNKG